MATWMQTHTGRPFDYKDVFPIDDFNLLDIAHSLAHLPRYFGHFGGYSVAQHCVLLADYAFKMRPPGSPRMCARTALFHDGAEAYGVNRFETNLAAAISETLERPHAW